MKKMIQLGGMVCVALVLLLVSTLNVLGQYTTLTVPGAEGTYAYSISGTNVLGSYTDTNGNSHCVIFNGSTYTAFTVPGLSEPEPSGISGSEVVGTYYNTSGQAYGFLYTIGGGIGGILSVPGAQSTEALGISGTNIVGVFVSGFTVAAFLYTIPGGNYTMFSYGAYKTWAYGVSGTNIVGTYLDSSGHYQGFIYNPTWGTGGTLSVPEAEQTEAFGIDGTNIVGTYYTANGNVYGFLHNGSTYTTLSVPGAERTYAYGICGTNIVGYYFNGSNYDGFMVSTIVLPIVTNQPQSQAALLHSNVTFSVAASGGQPLMYQWYFNNTNMIGKTNSTLTIQNINTNDMGNYFVVVSNVFGSVTSTGATLTIIIPPQSFNIQKTNANQLVLQLIGTANYPYILQMATNLTPPINWQAVITNPADANGNWSFAVTNSPNIPCRFYRAAGQ